MERERKREREREREREGERRTDEDLNPLLQQSSIGGPRALTSEPQELPWSKDMVFGPEASQQEVLQAILEPQLQRFLEEPGFSAVFLAYGQTGSGKTHTIFGPPGVLTEHDYNQSGGYPQSWGFFPYAAVATLTALSQKGLLKRAQVKLACCSGT